VELSDKVDPAAVKREALVHGVDCRPGERFFGDSEQGKMHMRIAFSMVSMEEIERGLGVLGDAIEASLP
jgi:DNA-binding transcriptional MocR family regulator